MSALSFEISHRDASTNARVGRATTPHGSFDTPAFMPVGTQGSVKGLLPHLVRAGGAQIILGNTYHLLLRPGSELVAQMGGLQRWSGWGGPMLTDSGGFQVFSLADINKMTDDGVTFQSHIDGATIELTPELSMKVQNDLGADVIMAFDDCPPASSDEPTAEYVARVKLACERSARWLDRCVKAHARPQDQALFPIVQGGTDPALRDWCIEHVLQHDMPGYAIGGVAVGEGPDEIRSIVEHTAPQLPDGKPRYLMGVGYPRDIVAAVRAGVDMFDCVLPTRNGRNANAFTATGQIRLRNSRFRDDALPIEAGCDCLACAGPGAEGLGSGDGRKGPQGWIGGPFSRSYIRHLFMAGEMLGPILVSLHNLRFFERLLLDIRRAIADNAWSAFSRRWPVAEC